MHGTEVNGKFSMRPMRDEHSLAERMQEILNEDQDNFVVALTKLYQSAFCRWMYIFMAVLCSILVIWSLFMGKKWSGHWLFVCFELIINFFIVLDIAFKMKLLGIKQFFADCNNLIDFVLGTTILVCFLFFFYLKSSRN